MERAIETALYHSRWLLAPIYFGLAALLGIVAVAFLREVWRLGAQMIADPETDMILATLTLIDLALVASLLVMVALSGYENFVSRIEAGRGVDRLPWFGRMDAHSLKLNLASTIVAISSIHLLKAFMEVEQTANDKLMWLVIIHITFVVSTLLMAGMDRLKRKDAAASLVESRAPLLGDDRIDVVPAQRREPAPAE